MNNIMSKTLEELITKTFSHYLRVLPQGFEIYPNYAEEEITVKLLHYSPARTLYENKKPVCRSLNGISDLENKSECASCQKRIKCISQIYLEIEREGRSWRLMLSYTSAKNFMSFCSLLRQKKESILDIKLRLRVLDRGRWGEIRFSIA
jgi:hypothetical protein